MLGNQRLLAVRGFEFRLQHLLIIGILVLGFSLATIMRSQSVEYGFELNEFDPFFNYRATQYMVENGIPAYFEWHDDKSWHPEGRDISATSQVALHMTAALLYPVFGAGMPLYHFVILFPLVFGSLTVIVVFALIRVIGGTTAGLFASLLFAISVPVISRGTIGWFKSEPLGLFYGLLATYLFLSGIKSGDRRVAAAKIASAGIFMGLGLNAWGGIQFFMIPFGVFFLALPFLRRDHGFLLWAIPLFTAVTMCIAALFERPGPAFVTGLGGLLMIMPAVFMTATILVMRISGEARAQRNGLLLIAGLIAAGTTIIILNDTLDLITFPEYRYLNAVNPFLTTLNALVDSVAEHSTPGTSQSFYLKSVLMIFAGIGIWLIFRVRRASALLKSKNDLMAFALITGMFGVYISSSYIRLELFASIAIIILASLCLSIMTSEIFRNRESTRHLRNPKPVLKIVFVGVLVAFLSSPLVFPQDAGWVHAVKAPPTLLNGGSTFNVVTDDWPETFAWIRNNTSPDDVIASWWDYGYWITTLSDRKTLADNFTVDHQRIQNIARSLLSEPDISRELLLDLDSDYVLIYVAGQVIQEEPKLYWLGGGGDESKKIWFIRIAEQPVQKYLHTDGASGTDHFWDNTALGHMMPFDLVGYYDFRTGNQQATYVPGYQGIYQFQQKYPEDGDGPFRIAYMSPSLHNQTNGIINGVLIYEINKGYDSAGTADTGADDAAQDDDIANDLADTAQDAAMGTSATALLETAQGDILIELDSDVAPMTVENFVTLAESGFYDGTIFHRIIPGFVIQGGDPNTISGPPETWGTGSPGYTIDPEFSDLKHTKYVVSMARSAAIDSAGSQFFIMLGDSPALDGQYTIFGRVISGHETVDAIGALETNNQDQPVTKSEAVIERITIP